MLRDLRRSRVTHTRFNHRSSPSYPAANGFYFGVGTMGGGGNVNVSVPGVNTSSLVTNQISANTDNTPGVCPRR